MDVHPLGFAGCTPQIEDKPETEGNWGNPPMVEPFCVRRHDASSLTHHDSSMESTA
jgi:hypothetical protein